MSDIFREVDEEIRHERYMKLWKRYGPWVVAVVLALVLAVAGYQGWQAYKRSQAIAASKTYAAAVDKIEAGNSAAALKQLDQLADSGSIGYRILARFRRADVQVANGDKAAAVQTWTGLADSAQVPEPYGSLARLFAVMHQMDGGDPEALSRQLDNIVQADTAFRPTALELQAVLAVRAGDREKAVDLYKQIADGANVPQRQRQRATQMLSQIEG